MWPLRKSENAKIRTPSFGNYVMVRSTLRTLGGFAFSADGATAVRPDTQKTRANALEVDLRDR